MHDGLEIDWDAIRDNIAIDLATAFASQKSVEIVSLHERRAVMIETSIAFANELTDALMAARANQYAEEPNAN